MNLDNLVVSDVEETITEMRIVKANVAFEMVDGKCVDESLQPLYDKFRPVAKEVAETTEQPTIQEEWEA